MSAIARRFVARATDGHADEPPVDNLAALISDRDELLTACKWFVDQLERGVIVRDITKDAQPDWAMRMRHFVIDLQKVIQAIAKAEGRS